MCMATCIHPVQVLTAQKTRSLPRAGTAAGRRRGRRSGRRRAARARRRRPPSCRAWQRRRGRRRRPPGGLSGWRGVCVARVRQRGLPQLPWAGGIRVSLRAPCFWLRCARQRRRLACVGLISGCVWPCMCAVAATLTHRDLKARRHTRRAAAVVGRGRDKHARERGARGSRIVSARR